MGRHVVRTNSTCKERNLWAFNIDDAFSQPYAIFFISCIYTITIVFIYMSIVKEHNNAHKQQTNIVTKVR